MNKQAKQSPYVQLDVGGLEVEPLIGDSDLNFEMDEAFKFTFYCQTICANNFCIVICLPATIPKHTAYFIRN